MAQDTPTPAPQRSGEPPVESAQANSTENTGATIEPGASAPSAAAPLGAAIDADGGAEALSAALAANPPELDQVSIDELLKQASFEDPAALGSGNPADDAANFKLPNFQQVMQDAQVSSIDLLRDVELNVKIELGRARMLVEDVLKLSEGSVVELDKLAGDPVDVFVNDRLVARGEVLVLNDNFCVRVNEIVAGVKEEGM
jgi:flagellar motor switch protein FliN/FliY